jgi:hypothetical protein
MIPGLIKVKIINSVFVNIFTRKTIDAFSNEMMQLLLLSILIFNPEFHIFDTKLKSDNIPANIAEMFSNIIPKSGIENAIYTMYLYLFTFSV